MKKKISTNIIVVQGVSKGNRVLIDPRVRLMYFLVGQTAFECERCGNTFFVKTKDLLSRVDNEFDMICPICKQETSCFISTVDWLQDMGR